MGICAVGVGMCGNNPLLSPLPSLFPCAKQEETEFTVCPKLHAVVTGTLRKRSNVEEGGGWIATLQYASCSLLASKKQIEVVVSMAG